MRHYLPAPQRRKDLPKLHSSNSVSNETVLVERKEQRVHPVFNFVLSLSPDIK